MANLTKKLNAGQVIEDTTLVADAAGLIAITAGKAASYGVDSIISVANIGNVTIAADKYSSININQIQAATKVGNVKVTAAIDANVTASIDTTDGSVGTITTDAGINANVGLAINAFVSAVATATAAKSATVGNVLVNSNGTYSSSNIEVDAVNAKIGSVTVNAKGVNAKSYIELSSTGILTTAGTLQGGGIGNIALTATGADSYTEAQGIVVTAIGGIAALTGSVGNITATASGTGSEVYSEEAVTANNANIGNVTAVASGTASRVYFDSISAVAGNIGNVSLTASGAQASTELTTEAIAALSTSGTPTLLGGNIGNVVLKASGLYSYVEYDATATGTFVANGAFKSAVNIGNVTLDVTGIYAEADVDVNTLNGGNIGNIIVNNKASSEFDFSASAGFGNIKSVTVNNSGKEATTNIDISATSALDDSATPVRIGGKIGALTANASAEGAETIVTVAEALSVDAVTIKASARDAVAVTTMNVVGANDGGNLVGGKVGNISLSATGQASVALINLGVQGIVTSNATDYALANTAKVGNIVSTVSGTTATGVINIFANEADALGVDIGNITTKVTGNDAQQIIAIDTQAGNIGNVSMNVAGTYALGGVNLTAHSLSVNDGKIGNISLTATGDQLGDQPNLLGNISAHTSIGTFTNSISGFAAKASTEIYLGNDDIAIVKAATLGISTLNVKGDNAQNNLNIYGYVGSDVDGLKLNIQGGSNVNGYISTVLQGTDTDVATLGDVTVAVTNANTSDSQAYVTLGGFNNTIGNITGTATGGISTDLQVIVEASSMTNVDGGSIGNVTLSNSSEGGYTSFEGDANFFGDIKIDAKGAQSDFDITLSGSNVDAQIGAITVTLSADLTGQTTANGNITYFEAGEIDISDAENVGLIKLLGGSATSQVSLTVESDSLDGVDFGGFNGNGLIDLGGVGANVTVIVAKGGNTIATTDYNDTITTGTGVDVITTRIGSDTVKFLKVSTGGALDTITDFSVGDDKLDFAKLGLGASGSVFVAGELNAGRFVPSINGSELPSSNGFAQFLYNTTTGVLSYDADGSGANAAIEIVTLTGAPAITAADILIS